MFAFLACMTTFAGLGCGGDRSEAPPPREPEAGIEPLPIPEPVFGVAEPNAWLRAPAPATPAEIARRIAQLGATSQRFVVSWHSVEPEPPVDGHQYNFAPFDAMYRADLRYGVRPLLVALNAPGWAADPGATDASAVNNPPAVARLPDWQAFLKAVTQRYPGALGIEIWNEPNLATFWAGGSGSGVRPDPVRYTQLLEASYRAIKSVDPGMLVVGGALLPKQGPSPSGDVAGYEFARRMFDSGAAAYMDAISLHPYPGSGGSPLAVSTIDQIRQVRDQFGAQTPIWLTETGVTTTGPSGASDQDQAALLVELCRAVSIEPGVEAVYIHNLIEQTGPDAGFDAGFGLLRPLSDGGLSAKPAYGALRTTLAAPGGCAR